MGFFDALKGATNKLKREVNKAYGSSRDFLEACAAAAALVAAAEGGISDEEQVGATESIAANPTLGDLYDRTAIEDVMGKMCLRAKTPSGRMSLLRELDDVVAKENSGRMRQDVYLVAFDVACGDGSVGPKEREQLDKIAKRLGVNPRDLES